MKNQEIQNHLITVLDKIKEANSLAQLKEVHAYITEFAVSDPRMIIDSNFNYQLAVINGLICGKLYAFNIEDGHSMLELIKEEFNSYAVG